MKLILFIILIVLHQVIFIDCTDRPIVGILSQEIWYEEFGPECHPATNYITADYVKAVEAAGGRAVPIFIQKNLAYYKNLLQSINGVIFPGGNAPLEPGNGYYDAAMVIYKLSKEINDRGTFFPILGVCLGFEALLIITNNNKDMQNRCNVINEKYPLIFSKDFRRSIMYATLPLQLYMSLKYLNITLNYHTWCTTNENFTKDSLDKEWLITATNINMHGLEFISSVEHKKYPFLAVQFHPEQSLEWNSSNNFSYSKNSILANKYFYDLFISLTKLNANTFRKEKDKRDALINNYYPRKLKPGSPIDEIYAFN